MFKASLFFLGLQMALRSAAQSRAGANALRKEPTNSVSSSEGLQLGPLALQTLQPSKAALPGVVGQRVLTRSQGKSAAKFKPKCIAEHCLKFPGAFEDDKQC